MSGVWYSALLRPLDTLVLRGGEPFNAGEDHYVRSQFPPSPRAFQGMVRTKLLQDAGIDLDDRDAVREFIGTKECLPDDLRIQGPFPFAQENLWFPAPRYLAQDSAETWHRMMPHENLATDLGLSLPARPSAGFLTPLEAWLSWPEMRWALWGLGPGKVCPRESLSLWMEEIRTGIARSRGKAARQGHLYSIGHIRLAHQTTLWFQATRAVAPGILPVGGEGRLAEFSPGCSFDLSLPEEVAQAIGKEGRFWLVLVQPARFSGGWKPDFDADGVGELRVKLVTAVVGSSQPIGGFDLANQRPHALWSYVPGGSAYLLELVDPPSDTPTKLQKLHNTCAVGEESERSMGFGHVMIGRVLEASQ